MRMTTRTSVLLGGILAALFGVLKGVYASSICVFYPKALSDSYVHSKGFQMNTEGMRVDLLGSLESILDKNCMSIQGGGLTVGNVLEEIANQNFEAKKCLFHRDGRFRKTARVLVDGKTASSMELLLGNKNQVMVVTVTPCDG